MPIQTQTVVKQRSVKEAIYKGVKGKCPNCGEGKLFDKWLKVTPVCSHCSEELYHERAQDFPPYIVITIVGHVVVTLLLIMINYYDVSLLTHMLLWIPLATVMSIALMQPAKGGVVGMQWALRMFGFDGNGDHD